MKLHSAFMVAVTRLLPALCGGCPCCSSVANSDKPAASAVLGAGSRAATAKEAKVINLASPVGRPRNLAGPM